MDKLEQQLKASSERARDLQPSEGQWEAIRSQLDHRPSAALDPASGSTATAARWRSYLLIGLAVAMAGLGLWWIATSQASSAGSDTEVKHVRSEDINYDPSTPREPKAEMPLPEGAGSPLLQVQEIDPAPLQLPQSGSSPSSPLADAPSSGPTTNWPYSEADRTDSPSRPSAPSLKPALPAEDHTAGRPIVPSPIEVAIDPATRRQELNRLMTAPLATGPAKPLDLELRLPDNWPAPGAAAFSGSGYRYRTGSWRAVRENKPRWEVSLNALAIPLRSYQYFSRTYTQSSVEGTEPETIHLRNGDQFSLYRNNVEGRSVSSAKSWFLSASLVASRRFANGIRVAAGLSYMGDGLWRSTHFPSSFLSVGADLYVWRREYRSDWFYTYLTLEYTIWRRRRFHLSLGASAVATINSHNRLNNRLIQPATQEIYPIAGSDDRLYIYDDQGIQIVPQFDLEYQLNRRTSLSLAGGVRAGIGVRHWLGN